MRRSTQNTLYHLLPVVFWLLAIGGIVLWEYCFTSSLFLLLPAGLALVAVLIIRRIPRHTESVNQCFNVALLLGIASYWLPTVLFLALPIWGYLVYQNLFNLRSFCATLLGLALVAVWAAVAVHMGWIANPWASFFSIENARGWIPTGAVLIAWLASTIARQTLRVR